MNPSKRAILLGACDVIEQIALDEDQDLRDQPDSIEDDDCSDKFRQNVVDLKAALNLIEGVVNR